MKTPFDPRHKKRIKAIKSLFSWDFQPKTAPENKQSLLLRNKLAGKVLKKVAQIDKIITKAAPEWPIQQINRIDLAILRLAVYELVVAKKEPPKVIIDEAVELAKAYGGQNSPKFVNGVLGTILKQQEDKK
ncbi:transcription antitermination factor NusB [Candidatus Shapirobacteria bacterium CG_4_9_14_0_2_um_filter_39_11]|uniref:Transcription antitermination protein NusB n=1 Tax=Candidatus Shapirobacteria bacterium CG_4_9_14_0_2_um_filter_39_11 TaxID=1974478 RepID=A0A2M8ET80_9BACT|nr:MAG: transcription antitermination factor NusB [Candidatus Shapirobacteria bacterium CG_4_9_14_0_2_um_filter_39_11]